jgi:hypothetical protein
MTLQRRLQVILRGIEEEILGHAQLMIQRRLGDGVLMAATSRLRWLFGLAGRFF